MEKDIESQVRDIVAKEILGVMPSQRPIPIGVSARHIHLTREHLDELFGRGYNLTKRADLSQPGQFACEETVTLVGPGGVIERVRILGPTRSKTQVEVSFTDARRLGLKPPIRESGNIKGTPGITIVGPAGSVTIGEGVIVAMRHIHMTPEDAEEFRVSDGEFVKVICGTERAVIFDRVLVRVSEKYALDFHIDTDEANACGVKSGDVGYLLKMGNPVKAPVYPVITKRLITEADVRSALKTGAKIVVGKGTIVTPLAMELGKKTGVLEFR